MTMASESNVPITSWSNDHGSIASKYRFLFNLNSESRILLLGEHSEELHQDFVEVFDHVYLMAGRFPQEEIAQGAPYDLIFVSSFSAATLTWFTLNVSQICRFARPDAVLLVAVPRRMGIQNITRWRINYELIRSSRSVRAYRKLIKDAGFKEIRENLMVPDHNNPDDFIDANVGTIELRSNINPIIALAVTTGIYRYLHRDIMFIAYRDMDNAFSLFLGQLHKELEKIGVYCKALTIDRFCLRTRGSIIVFVTELNSSSGFVVRISPCDAVDRVTRMNCQWLNRIHQNDKFSQVDQCLVPQNLAAFRYRDCMVYVETRSAGVIAWKYEMRPRVEGRLFECACRFLYSFNCAFKEKLHADRRVFDEIIGHDLRKVEQQLLSSQLNRSIVSDIRGALESLLMRRDMQLVVGHGDFGYGNILYNVRDGKISGVIDWDTAISRELPTVDLINLIILRVRRDLRCDTAVAIDQLFENPELRLKLSWDRNFYDEREFGLRRHDFAVSLCVAGIRTVTRSLNFPDEFHDRIATGNNTLRSINRILQQLVTSDMALAKADAT